LTQTVLLFLFVLAGFSIEAALGFGATVVAVSLAAFVLPLNEFLPAFLPLNLVVSSVLVARNLASVDRPLLFGRVIPIMAVGLPIGLYVSTRLDPIWMRRAFGAFVVVLSVVELRRKEETAGSGRWVDAALLFLGGLIHGFFATGGPMAVYVLGRRLPDKGAFRATLSALWIVLNAVLVAAYAMDGSIGRASLERTALLAPAMIVGLLVRQWAHERIPAASFRRGLFVALAVVGAVLIVKG